MPEELTVLRALEMGYEATQGLRDKVEELEKKLTELESLKKERNELYWALSWLFSMCKDIVMTGQEKQWLEVKDIVEKALHGKEGKRPKV